MVRNVAFVWGQGHAKGCKNRQDGANMLDVFFERVRKNNDVVDITLCISFMGFENFIHELLHVARRPAISHRGDVENLLPSMCYNRQFPPVLLFDITLVKRIESPEVHNWTSLPFMPYNKNRPTGRNNSFSSRHTTVSSCLVKDLVDFHF